jgi:hypothetical protein
MPGISEQLPAEVAHAVLSDPKTRRKVEHIRDHIIAQIEWAYTYGQEPTGFAAQVLKGLLRGLIDQEASERDREVQEQFEAMREFVQQFRKRKGSGGD